MKHDFKRIKLIDSVWETPIIVQEYLYYLKMNEFDSDLKVVQQLFLDTLSNKVLNKFFTSSLAYYNNIYMLYDGNEQTVRFYDDKLCDCIKEFNKFRIISWKEEESLVFFYNDIEKSVVQIDLNNFDIIGSLPYRIANVTKFFNKVFFTEVNIIAPKLLSCYESGFTKQNWQVNLTEDKFDSIPPDERYFGRDFFCWQDVLIVRIGRAGYAGLSMETGELIWENYEVYDSTISDGKLYSVGGGRFSIVNALNGKTELMYDVTEQFSALQLSVTGKFTLVNNLIYFKNYNGKLGIFSIEERKVIWHYDLNTSDQKVTFGATEAPVVAGDKLMILDLNHVLHIFQRAN